jgi:hypothetical protein
VHRKENRQFSFGEVSSEPKIYDVFKETAQKKALWLGSVNRLQRALDQMKRMSAQLPGEYFISDAATQEVIASVHSA